MRGGKHTLYRVSHADVSQEKPNVLVFQAESLEPLVPKSFLFCFPRIPLPRKASRSLFHHIFAAPHGDCLLTVQTP